MNFTKLRLWSKITGMKVLEVNFKKYFEQAEYSLYDVALDVGLDPSNTTKVLYQKRPATFDKRLEIIKTISQSPKLKLSYGTMARWLAEEYLPPEALDAKAALVKAARKPK